MSLTNILTLPKTMAAIVCHAPEDYRLQEVRLPTPGAGQALLRVYGAGICAGDPFHKDWTIVGGFAACHTLPPTIAWLANGLIEADPMVSDTVPMEALGGGAIPFLRSCPNWIDFVDLSVSIFLALAALISEQNGCLRSTV